MENLPNCPKCNSEYTYEDGSLVVCPECGYEWNPNTQEEENVIKDVNGNVLNDGDSVTVVKDLKVKGASSSIKIGTKVKNIRLVPDAADGHDIECKIDGFGAMKLKSSVVKRFSVGVFSPSIIIIPAYCFSVTCNTRTEPTGGKIALTLFIYFLASSLLRVILL